MVMGKSVMGRFSDVWVSLLVGCNGDRRINGDGF